MHHDLKTRKRWKVEALPDGSERWTSLLGFTHVRRPSQLDFVSIEPPPEDEPPAEIAERLPDGDPYPTADEIPLPEPPPLTDAELEEFEELVETLDLFGLTIAEAAERHYDECRTAGLLD